MEYHKIISFFKSLNKNGVRINDKICSLYNLNEKIF